MFNYNIGAFTILTCKSLPDGLGSSSIAFYSLYIFSYMHEEPADEVRVMHFAPVTVLFLPQCLPMSVGSTSSCARL